MVVNRTKHIHRSRGSRTLGRSRAFTIIEIMLALAILSILMTIALPRYWDRQDEMDRLECKRKIVMLSQRLETYNAFNYGYPEYLTDIGFTEKDPWGNDYQYLNLDDVDPKSGKIKTGGKGPKPSARKKKNLKPLNTDYDLFCMGPDGDYKPNVSAKASLDDVIRADDGAFIDLAENY